MIFVSETLASAGIEETPDMAVSPTKSEEIMEHIFIFSVSF